MSERVFAEEKLRSLDTEELLDMFYGVVKALIENLDLIVENKNEPWCWDLLDDKVWQEFSEVRAEVARRVERIT